MSSYLWLAVCVAANAVYVALAMLDASGVMAYKSLAMTLIIGIAFRKEVRSLFDEN